MLISAPISAQELPSALESDSGQVIQSLESWQKHRLNLQRRFQQEIYGYLPQKPKVSGFLLQTGKLVDLPGSFEEHVILFEWQGHLIRRLHLAILKPDKPSSSVLLFLNKCGNQSLLAASVLTPYLALYPQLCPDEMSEPGWQAEYWHVQSALLAGLTLMTVHESEIAPDDPQAFKQSQQQLPESLFQAGPWPGLIALWAWGLQGVNDYVKILPAFKHTKLGLLGHSRRGKAALLAAALDQSFDFVIPHQTGTFGAAPLALNPAESKASITYFFPHWFTSDLAHTPNTELSVDQHQLLALIAPRPLLITEGRQDLWASPELSFKALQAAWPVYQLYGHHSKTKLLSWEPKHPDVKLLSEPAAHILTEDRHTLNKAYWDIILTFLKAQGLLSD